MNLFLYNVDESDFDNYRLFSTWTDPVDALWEYAEMCWTRGNGGKNCSLDISVIPVNIPYNDYVNMNPCPEAEEQNAVYWAIQYNLREAIPYESVVEW